MMVPKRGRRVQAGEREQRVGQPLMNVLGRMEDARVRSDAEIELEEAIIERPAVPDKGDDSEHGDGEHERIEEMMRRERCPPGEFSDVGRQIRRLVRGAPTKSRDDQRDIDEADASVHVDPEWPRLFRNVVEQKAERAEEDDQRRHRPMEGDRAGAVTIRRRREFLSSNYVSHRKHLALPPSIVDALARGACSRLVLVADALPPWLKRGALYKAL